MIKDNELIITTSEGFEIIRIINTLGMKDEIIDTITKYFNLDNEKKTELLKINKFALEKDENFNSLDEEERIKITDSIFIEHMEIKNKLDEVQTSIRNLVMDIALTFISRFPQAEKEIYKALSKMFGKNIKDIENGGLDAVLSMLKDISKSPTIPKLLSFFN